MTDIDVRRIKTVDSREPEIIKGKLLEIGWVTEQLYTADYWFMSVNYKKIGIERKAVPDLINSLGDRLSSQLYKMMEHYDFSILLIEGNWRMVQDKVMTTRGIEQWGWSTVWNFLQSWQDRGLTIQLTANEGHTIRRLNELYAYYCKESHAGGLRKSHVEDSRILALQCGGIGPKIGAALLSRFGSIKSIANASVDDFLTVDKIGQAKAEALYKHFNVDGRN
jgi:ERCC4-type nuclease